MELKIPGSGDVEISNQMKSLRSGGFIGCDAWRAPKMATTEADFWVDANAAVSSDAHMLKSFPCSSTVTSTLPDYQQMEGQFRSSGYNSGSSDASTGVYFVNGGKGPFTQSQWLELEHQALIYRYITANQPIPIQLLIPIRKAIESAGFCGRWRPSHLGYSSRTDPEPGRCRRTDGKKWRCTKEAIEKKKYCDKHISRGRNRSRKHLECQATKSSRGKNLKTIRSDVTAETSLNRMIVQNRDSSGSSFTISKHQNSSPEAPQRNICNNPKEFESQDSLYTLLDNNIGVEFMSSSYSPNNEKVSFASQWEASIGGPLAEALQSKISNNTDES